MSSFTKQVRAIAKDVALDLFMREVKDGQWTPGDIARGALHGLKDSPDLAIEVAKLLQGALPGCCGEVNKIRRLILTSPCCESSYI